VNSVTNVLLPMEETSYNRVKILTRITKLKCVNVSRKKSIVLMVTDVNLSIKTRPNPKPLKFHNLIET